LIKAYWEGVFTKITTVAKKPEHKTGAILVLSSQLKDGPEKFEANVVRAHALHLISITLIWSRTGSRQWRRSTEEVPARGGPRGDLRADRAGSDVQPDLVRKVIEAHIDKAVWVQLRTMVKILRERQRQGRDGPGWITFCDAARSRSFTTGETRCSDLTQTLRRSTPTGSARRERKRSRAGWLAGGWRAGRFPPNPNPFPRIGERGAEFASDRRDLTLVASRERSLSSSIQRIRLGARWRLGPPREVRAKAPFPPIRGKGRGLGGIVQISARVGCISTRERLPATAPTGQTRARSSRRSATPRSRRWIASRPRKTGRRAARLHHRQRPLAFAVLFGVALGAPFWLRRRRTGAPAV